MTLPPDAGAPRMLSSGEQLLLAGNRWALILMMGSMACLVFANVIARYLFNDSIIWVEEFTQFEMIWITFLGAGLALREGRHVAVEILEDYLPAGLRGGSTLKYFKTAANLPSLLHSVSCRLYLVPDTERPP